jgi:MFS family permease
MITGDIRVYYTIQILQLLLCSTTTATVYCRVIAERFESARGLAFGILACGPGVVALVGSPLLGHYIEGHGWRQGALVFALYSATAGALAMLLMPSSKRSTAAAKPKRSARKDYPLIFRTPAFWVIAISAFLCSVPFALTQTQLSVMLLDRHLSPTVAASIISTFAAGAMAGRLFMGMALDRFPIHLVAAIGMALSGIGLFILSVPVTEVWVLILGVGLFGLSFGAESDVMGYAVVRYFGIEIYSSVLGLLTGAIGAAMATGSIVLTFMLAGTDSYSLFMLLAGTGVLLGSLNFLRLRGLAVFEAAPPIGEKLEMLPE